MCCIPVLCGAIQSQLHIAYQCSAESPLLTMVARTTSGGHYQAHVAVLECVFLYNHCMFFISYLCFTASRYGVLKAKSLFCSISSYTGDCGLTLAPLWPPFSKKKNLIPLIG